MNRLIQSTIVLSLLCFFTSCPLSQDNQPDSSDPAKPLGDLTMAVSPGHGLRESDAEPGKYIYQRSEVNGILEDIYTQEFCMEYLYPALEEQGAIMLPLRQRNRLLTGISGEAAWKESSLLCIASQFPTESLTGLWPEKIKRRS